MNSKKSKRSSVGGTRSGAGRLLQENEAGLSQQIFDVCRGEGTTSPREREVVARALASKDAVVRCEGVEAVRVRGLWKHFGRDVKQILRAEKNDLVLSEAVDCAGECLGTRLKPAWWRRHLLSKSWMVRSAALNGMMHCRGRVDMKVLLVLRAERHETVIAAFFGVLLSKARAVFAATALVSLATAAETLSGRKAAANVVARTAKWLSEEARAGLRKRLRKALRVERSAGVRSAIRHAITDLT